MRLFVALDPPPKAVAELRAALRPVRAAFPDLRWSPVATWHLTLAFLGDVERARVAALCDALAAVAARHPAPRLSLAGAGRFGERVLWVPVHGDPEPLGALADDVARAVAAGVPSEPSATAATGRNRAFRPHLTVARRRGRDRPHPSLARAVTALSAFTGAPWTADRLRLVCSRIGPGPARHTDVASWPLGPLRPLGTPPPLGSPSSDDLR